jgi:uncharacterized protein (DUF924 family)
MNGLASIQMNADSKDLLTFWLGEQSDSQQDQLSAIKRASRRWFSSTPALDAQIKDLYEPLIHAAAMGELQTWRDTPQGRLALIVLLDQFPRNIYRGTAQAFAYDPLALDITLETIVSCPAVFSLFERAALYMPLQHSEDLQVQQHGVSCYTALTSAAPDTEWRDFLLGFENSARQHCDIIQRFGRFPHRNAVLARESSNEEREYLISEGVRFGQ